MNVEGVIERVKAMYAAARLYSDRGTVAADLGEEPFRAGFATSFERPNRFALSFSDTSRAGEPLGHGILLEGADSASVTICGEAAGQNTLGAAVARLAGITFGAAHAVPRLLMPERVGGRCLFDGAQRALGGPTVIDDARHLVVELEGRMRVFVNERTWLIRRVESCLLASSMWTTDYFAT